MAYATSTLMRLEMVVSRPYISLKAGFQRFVPLPGRPVNETITRPISETPSALDLNAKTLDSLLAESIDEVLENLVGKKAKEAILDHLERNHSLAREDIPKNVQKFFALTDQTFGEKGSRTIARCIAKRLWENLGWRFENIEGFEFQDYLEAARARIARELVEKAKASMLDARKA